MSVEEIIKAAKEAYVERLAKQLHREYRAAEKAMTRGSIGYGSLNRLLHDHGYDNCNKKKYFLKRARLIIKRSLTATASTLGQREENSNARMFKGRLMKADSE